MDNPARHFCTGVVIRDNGRAGLGPDEETWCSVVLADKEWEMELAILIASEATIPDCGSECQK